MTVYDDLADLWEPSAVDSTPLRAIVGVDPVQLAEMFAQAHTGRHWMDTERARLVSAIKDAEQRKRK